MEERLPADDPEDRTLSRVALYIILLAWISIALYIYSACRSGNDRMFDYFLSASQSGIKFRPLILLAPFAMTIIAYLVNEREKFFNEVLTSEKKLQKANAQLARQAFYDSLTNLPNRALFMDHLHKSVERKKRCRDYSFAIIFFDLDRFKIINGSLGHIVGDQLLIMVTQRLTKHVRSVDTLARLGGDEFAILARDIKEASYLEDIAERLKADMRPPFSIFEHEIFATISIGMVIVDAANKKRPDELLRDADTAMYNAKARGRSCHVVFDPAMHAEATEALRLETELRLALDRKELTLYYQPIVSLDRNCIMGFEALLRWLHPERGVLNASQFIGAAEEAGLILSVEQWIIREACRQLKAWQTRFPAHRALTVSVNVSAAVVSRPGFYELIENILCETGLDGSCLRLEIIERTLMENPEQAAALIRRLCKLNVRFDIDDFGTGYSALNYLRHFPVRGLKIDRSFIKALSSDENNAKIVKTIVALGNELGLDVVAEGVESVEQLNVFRTMGGEYAQGFHLFRPMDGNATEELLGEN